MGLRGCISVAMMVVLLASSCNAQNSNSAQSQFLQDVVNYFGNVFTGCSPSLLNNSQLFTAMAECDGATAQMITSTIDKPLTALVLTGLIVKPGTLTYPAACPYACYQVFRQVQPECASQFLTVFSSHLSTWAASYMSGKYPDSGAINLLAQLFALNDPTSTVSEYSSLLSSGPTATIGLALMAQASFDATLSKACVDVSFSSIYGPPAGGPRAISGAIAVSQAQLGLVLFTVAASYFMHALRA